MGRRRARRWAAPDEDPTVAQVAREVGMTPQAIYAWIKRGEVRTKQVGGRTVIPREDVRAKKRRMAEWRRRRRSKPKPLTVDELMAIIKSHEPPEKKRRRR